MEDNNNNDNNKEEKQDDSISNSTIIKEDHHNHNHQSPRKSSIGGVSGGGGDRLKRDEWSEGAVSTLLEAYEAKWVLRNRAKLKGHDWEDVAKHVSARGNSTTKSPKTQTQCKNKIESMKKRYRSESAAATTADASSSWPLYSRLDVLLRGTGPISFSLPTPPPLPPPPTAIAIAAPSISQSPHITSTTTNNLVLLEPPPSIAPPPSLANIAQNSHGSNGVERLLAKEDGLGAKSSEHVSNKNPMDSDSSTPALYSEKDKVRYKRKKMKSENNNNSNKRRIRNNNNNNNSNNEKKMEIAESIRWLAEVVVRSEETRMETMKEIERMRGEAEAKRGEMELKRTEIIANTQLEIARIFASTVNKSGVDSSLRIGRS